MAGPLAMLAAVTAFVLVAQTWRRYRGPNPSPVDWATAPDWVKRLVRYDPEPDPDPEPTPVGKRGYRLTKVHDHRTEVDWIDYNNMPPAIPEPVTRPADHIHRWVVDSLAQGTRPGQIIADGRRAFRVSESTMKRALRKARSRA